MTVRMTLAKDSRQYAGALPPEFAHETDDCAVRALMVAAGLPYANAHAILKAAGRQDRKDTYARTMDKAVRALDGISVPIRVRRNRNGYLLYPTLTQWLRVEVNRLGRWVILRDGHFFGVVDGVVLDWARGTGPRTRVRLAWRLP